MFLYCFFYFHFFTWRWGKEGLWWVIITRLQLLSIIGLEWGNWRVEHHQTPYHQNLGWGGGGYNIIWVGTSGSQCRSLGADQHVSTGGLSNDISLENRHAMELQNCIRRWQWNWIWRQFQLLTSFLRTWIAKLSFTLSDSLVPCSIFRSGTPDNLLYFRILFNQSDRVLLPGQHVVVNWRCYLSSRLHDFTLFILLLTGGGETLTTARIWGTARRK